MKAKEMKVIVLYYAALCSLANILHYMASRPRRQSSLETTICPYIILSHASQNSVSLNIPSLSCVQLIVFVFYFNEVHTLNTYILSWNSQTACQVSTNTLHSYTVYETTILPVLLYGCSICSLSVRKERIWEQCGDECFIQKHMNIMFNVVTLWWTYTMNCVSANQFT